MLSKRPSRTLSLTVNSNVPSDKGRNLAIKRSLLTSSERKLKSKSIAVETDTEL